jgi:hypothetical protein
MYIKADDVTQWMWSGLDSDDKQPDWDYGKLVFDGLMEGIAFTNTQRPLSDPSAQPHTYCMWRLKRLASDLTKIGIVPVLVAETLRQADDQGEDFINANIPNP